MNKYTDSDTAFKLLNIWVLLKHFAFNKSTGDKIEVDFTEYMHGEDSYTWEEINYCVRELQEKGAIKIHHVMTTASRHALPYGFVLEIIRPNFYDLEKSLLEAIAVPGSELEPIEIGLTFYSNGRTIYKSESGEVYEYVFKPFSNSFNLLKFLSTSDKEIYNFETLSKELKLPAEDDRTVRDTVKYIKDCLKIPKTERVFLVGNGYGINCVVHFKEVKN